VYLQHLRKEQKREKELKTVYPLLNLLLQINILLNNIPLNG
jgi:hypothetical protein